MIKILLVDDHPMLRQGVAQLIEMEEGLRVIAQAGDGREAVRKCDELNPDLVLLDLNMKGMSGIETLKILKEKEPATKVVIFSVSDNQADVTAALRAGADGYLLKDSEPEDLLPAIKQAALGEQVFSPELAGVMARALRKEDEASANAMAELTPRETSIVGLIAQGKSNKVIARELSIAEATVKVHVKHLLKKLSLGSRVEAALWAVENKMLQDTGEHM